MTRNQKLASATLAHLEALGTENIIVCAGARNAPLVTSLLATRERAEWKIWHHFDERTAAFFALGLAKKWGAPAAVVTTSGTAVAELLPAAIEAYYSGIPLILLTADRPASYRGSGAPQAIEQVGILGRYAPVALDIQEPMAFEEIAQWDMNEPLHLNLCFKEPQPEESVESWEPVSFELTGLDLSPNPLESLSDWVKKTGRHLVLLGELPLEWRIRVEKFLFTMGAPVWAESSSGLRESRALSDQLIEREAQISDFAPDHVLRIGGVPSLRFWRDLEDQPDIEVLSISRRPFSGLARPSALVMVNAFPEFFLHKKIESNFRKITIEDAHFQPFDGSETSAIREVSRMISSKSLIYLGNSMPIREWNLAASRDMPHPWSFASRGANGIDGQIATFLGLSDEEEESWAILGDLTALDDLNAPAFLSQLPKGRRRLVVINNGGGKIFSRLPSLAGLSSESKAVTENHHQWSFEAVAAMWGMEYRKWEPGDETFPKLESDHILLEVCPSAEETEAFWAAWK